MDKRKISTALYVYDPDGTRKVTAISEAGVCRFFNFIFQALARICRRSVLRSSYMFCVAFAIDIQGLHYIYSTAYLRYALRDSILVIRSDAILINRNLHSITRRSDPNAAFRYSVDTLPRMTTSQRLSFKINGILYAWRS